MANYNVGNIEIGITGTNKNALSSIDETISKLQEFRKIDKELQKVFGSINKLTNAFDKLSKLNTNNLSFRIEEISKATEDLNNKLSNIKQPTFVETAKAINRLTNSFRHLDKLQELDFAQMEQSFANIDRILTPFLSKLQASESSLKSLAIVLQKLSPKQISRINNELNKTSKVAKGAGKSLSNAFSIGKIYFYYNYSKRMLGSIYKMLTSAVDFNETLNKFQVSMGGYYQRSLEFVNDITKAFNLSTESIMDYMSTFKNMLSALGNLSEDTSYQLSETLTRMALDYASLFNVEVTRAMQQFQAVLSGQIRSIRSVSGYDVSETSIFGIYQQLGGTKTMRQLSQLEKRLLRIIALQRQMEETGAVGDFAKTINETSNQLKQLQETFKEIVRWVGQLTLVYFQPLVEKLLGFAIAIREVLKYLNIMNGYEYKDFGSGGFFGEEKSTLEELNDEMDEYKRNLLGFDTLNVLGSTTTTPASDISFLTQAILEYESKLKDVKNDANEIANVILKWIGYTRDANGELVPINSEFKNLLDSVFNLVSTLSKSLMPILKSILPLLEPILKIVVDVIELVSGILVPTLDLIAPVIETISNFVGTLLTLIGSILDLVMPLIDYLLKTIIPLILEPMLELIEKIIEPTQKVVDLFNLMLVPFRELMKGDFKGFIKAFSEMGEQLKKIWNNVWESIKGVFSNVINGIINAFAKFVNAFASSINGITSTLSGAWTWLGIPEIPEIPTWNPSPIELATGGVITQPTHALVGEYKGASSNPEIVTPENLMREVFLDSMLPVVQAIVNGNSQVVTAIKNKDTNVYMNGRKVSENLYNDLENVAIRKGKTLAFSR